MQLNKPLATVTPTLDGDVLAVLARTDTTFTISQVQRILTTASGEGIRKVLNRLRAQGVVLHDTVGRTHTYRLNTDHLAAEPIIALARLNATFLDRLHQHLTRWHQLRYAAVFGSAATGLMRLDSDIDLLLVRTATDTHSDEWEQQVSDLSLLITAWTGNDSSIIEYNDVELHAAAATAEPLLHDVAKHGLTVAGTRDWYTEQLRRPPPQPPSPSG